MDLGNYGVPTTGAPKSSKGLVCFGHLSEKVYIYSTCVRV